MDSPKCPKCENQNFEMAAVEPGNWRFKVMFVQCTNCKTVVGTMDYFNLSTLIHELNEKISNIETSLQEIEYEIGRLKKGTSA